MPRKNTTAEEIAAMRRELKRGYQSKEKHLLRKIRDGAKPGVQRL